MPKKQKRRYIDFAAIRRNVSWEEAIEHLNLNVSKRNEQYRCSCPVHPDRDKRGLAITPDEGFFCHESDGSGGDVISLVAHVLECSQYEAAAQLEGQEPQSRRTVPSTVPQKKPEAGANPPTLSPRARLERISEYLLPDHEAVLSLGFTPEEARELGIGYAPRGTLAGTIVIPIRDAEGTPVRCIGVLEGKLGKTFDLPATNVVPLKRPA